MSLAAFDLKIGTSADFFGIVDILPGEICDSCNWDFFNVRRIESKTPNSPGLLWQIVALSDMISDSTVSRCYGLNRPAYLLLATGLKWDASLGSMPILKLRPFSQLEKWFDSATFRRIKSL